jgi:hypothetical protein
MCLCVCACVCVRACVRVCKPHLSQPSLPLLYQRHRHLLHHQLQLRYPVAVAAAAAAVARPSVASPRPGPRVGWRGPGRPAGLSGRGARHPREPRPQPAPRHRGHRGPAGRRRATAGAEGGEAAQQVRLGGPHAAGPVAGAVGRPGGGAVAGAEAAERRRRDGREGAGQATPDQEAAGRRLAMMRGLMARMGSGSRGPSAGD